MVFWDLKKFNFYSGLYYDDINVERVQKSVQMSHDLFPA